MSKVMNYLSTFSIKQKRFLALFLVVLLVLVAVALYFVLYKQSLAFSKLKASATSEASYYPDVNKNPRLITGDFKGYDSEQNAKSVAWGFITANKDLYKISDLEAELNFVSEEENSNGTNVVYEQIYSNTKVYAASLTLRITKDFLVESVSSTFVPNIKIDTTAKITKEEAIKFAETKDPIISELMVYSPTVFNQKGKTVLIWYITGQEEDLLINAKDGSLVNSFATRFYLKNRNTYNSAESADFPGELWITEKGVVPDLAPGEPDSEATNVHDFAGNTYDYFKNRMGRDSYDNKGAEIDNGVHYRYNKSKPYNNAFWWKMMKRVVFGTGRGNSQDIVAHEWTHAMISKTTNLVYSGESGALNEAFADIFGTFVEFSTGGNSWTIGEGNGTILRDLKNPAKYNQPASTNAANYQSTATPCGKNNDYCGVHKNSGVFGKIAQLMVEGGTYDSYPIVALGQDKTEQLLYVMLTQKMTKTSGLYDLRNSIIEATAKGFVGANGIKYTFNDLEKASVINAFASAGVGEHDDNYDGKVDISTASKTKKNGDGIKVLKNSQEHNLLYPTPCEPIQAETHLMAHAFGKYEIKKTELLYQFDGDNEWKKIDETVGPYLAGGVGDTNWSNFVLGSFDKSGTINYRYRFYTKTGRNSNYVDSELYNLKVDKCVTSDSAMTDPILASDLDFPDQESDNGRSSMDSDSNSAKTTLQTITIDSNDYLDGYISSFGRVYTDTPRVGENDSDSDYARAFISFDLSNIPSDATVVSASLDLSDARVSGDPYGRLATLYITQLDYDQLDLSDFDATSEILTNITSAREGADIDLTTSTKNKCCGRDTKLQLRLQFRATNVEDRNFDYLTLPSGSIRLTVNFKS